MQNFDFVVIGSGPCGMLSASILSKKGKTLIVEEGPEINDREKDIYTFPQISSGYVGGGINVAFGIPPVLLSEGKCVGGGSAVNSSLHHRAPDHIWKKWREIFSISGFEQDIVNSSYEEIEKIFSAELGTISPSVFYQTAESIGEKVTRIPRWGVEDSKGSFDRWTARKIFKLKIKKNGGEINSLTRYLGAKRDKNNCWIIYLKDLKKKIKYSISASNLILALGAGKTPLALSKIGLSHKQLGKFEIHPSARVSCYFPRSKRSNAIVEPFQITGHFPYIMIGSSATRIELSESNYPFKNNLHNIDFSYVQNFYSMAPSNTKGKIILKGLFKGLKFYSLDKITKYSLEKGLNIIINVAKQAGAKAIYHTGMVLDSCSLNDQESIKKFIDSSIKKTLCSVHVMASAPIGENKLLCPLNSDGKIPGINNLLIIDQSTMPTCPTVNPQGTACVISYINSNKFLKCL